MDTAPPVAPPCRVADPPPTRAAVPDAPGPVLGSGVPDTCPADALRRTAPVSLIVLGMAGCGKTTLVGALARQLRSGKRRRDVINLDPAVRHLTYRPRFDIRDSVSYADMMSERGLGPNGAILACLSLYATRIPELLVALERRVDAESRPPEFILLDTPGQLECFTWSASGTIVTRAFGNTFPTVLVYVLDTVRCQSPVTFLSNMLYACSVVCRLRQPLVLVLNKRDAADPAPVLQWIADDEALLESLAGETTYFGSYMHSLQLVLDEFFSTLPAVAVSAATGAGLDDLLAAVERASTAGVASVPAPMPPPALFAAPGHAAHVPAGPGKADDQASARGALHILDGAPASGAGTPWAGDG